MNVLVDEEGKVSSYMLLIIDPMERHEYLYQFEQDQRDMFIDILRQLPDVGTMPPGQEEQILQ